MNAPEAASPMHLGAQGAKQRTCEACGGLFTPKRGWARFCSSKCRNDFHGREARIEAIRERALSMFEALRQIAATEGSSDDWQGSFCEVLTVAQQAIKDLKAP